MKNNSIRLLVLCFFAMSTFSGQAQLGKIKKPSVKSATKSVTKEVPTSTNEATKKAEECLELFNKISERENRIYKYLDQGKPSLCSSQISQYKRYLSEYKDALCPNAKQFEDKLPDLIAAVEQGKKDKKCREAKAEMDVYEARIVQGFTSNNYNSVNVAKGYFLRYYGDYKALECLEDYSEYETKIKKWDETIKNAAIAKDPLSHFCKSFYSNDNAGMEDAITNGLDIKATAIPLRMAVKSGDITKVDYMLSKGSNINLKDEDGNVPLDYSINIYPEQADIDMKKHLISKGADLKLAQGKWVASAAIEAGDFDFYKKVEAVNTFTTKDDLHFYWKAHSHAEMDKYFAEKIKSGNVGKSWSEVKRGLQNSSLEAEMLSLVKAEIVAEKMDIKITKIKIISADWGIYRHALSGVILYKGISAVGYGTDKNGVCFYKDLGYRKYYDGSNYGKTLLTSMHSGINIVDCD